MTGGRHQTWFDLVGCEACVRVYTERYECIAGCGGHVLVAQVDGDDDMEAGAVVEASSPARSVADTAGDDGGATPAGKAEDGEGVDREDEEGESADGGGE